MRGLRGAGEVNGWGESAGIWQRWAGNGTVGGFARRMSETGGIALPGDRTLGGICPDEASKRVVESTPVYLGYQIFFFLAYSAVLVWALLLYLQAFSALQVKSRRQGGYTSAVQAAVRRVATSRSKAVRESASPRRRSPGDESTTCGGRCLDCVSGCCRPMQRCSALCCSVFPPWCSVGACCVASCCGADILSSNKAVVTLCVWVGALVRGFSFVDSNCLVEEVLRTLRDLFFFAAFIFLTMFWVELTTSVQRIGNAERFRPLIFGTLAVYFVCRLCNGVTEIFAEDLQLIQWFFQGVTLLINGGTMLIAAIFGGRLLCSMSKMKGASDKVKQQLTKLTILLVGEIVVFALLMLAFLVRTAFFAKDKDSKPYQWFWAKVPEKVLELISVIILAAAMTDTSSPSSSTPAPSTEKDTNSKSDKGRRGGDGKKKGKKKKPGALELSEVEMQQIKAAPPSQRGALKAKLLERKKEQAKKKPKGARNREALTDRSGKDRLPPSQRWRLTTDIKKQREIDAKARKVGKASGQGAGSGGGEEGEEGDGKDVDTGAGVGGKGATLTSRTPPAPPTPSPRSSSPASPITSEAPSSSSPTPGGSRVAPPAPEKKVKRKPPPAPAPASAQSKRGPTAPKPPRPGKRAASRRSIAVPPPRIDSDGSGKRRLKVRLPEGVDEGVLSDEEDKEAGVKWERGVWVEAFDSDGQAYYFKFKSNNEEEEEEDVVGNSGTQWERPTVSKVKAKDCPKDGCRLILDQLSYRYRLTLTSDPATLLPPPPKSTSSQPSLAPASTKRTVPFIPSTSTTSTSPAASPLLPSSSPYPFFSQLVRSSSLSSPTTTSSTAPMWRRSRRKKEGSEEEEGGDGSFRAMNPLAKSDLWERRRRRTMALREQGLLHTQHAEVKEAEEDDSKGEEGDTLLAFELEAQGPVTLNPLLAKTTTPSPPQKGESKDDGGGVEDGEGGEVEESEDETW